MPQTYSYMDNWFANLDPGGSTTWVTQKPKYSPEQEELLKGLVAQARAGMGGPAPTSPEAYVPATASEQDYLNWAKEDATRYARGELPYEVGDQYVNQFMSAYKPVWERARNEAIDLYKANAAGPGYWGSERARGVGEIASDWGEKYAMQEAQLRMDQDAARRAAIDKYIGVGTGGMTTAGSMERNIQEQQKLSDLNRFLRGEEVGGISDPIYNQNVQLSLALLGISPFVYGQEGESRGESLDYGVVTGFMGGMGKGIGGIF